MIYSGIEYSEPEVFLLNDTGIGVAEIAARTCYDSFDASENQVIKDHHDLCNIYPIDAHTLLDDVNNIENSDLLHSLAWVHHHHSILEHTSVQFLIKGIGRGVLMEHSRHRLQNISVRSTRYTMSEVLLAFILPKIIDNITLEETKEMFNDIIKDLGVLIYLDENLHRIESDGMWLKLNYMLGMDDFGSFISNVFSKEVVEYIKNAIIHKDNLKDVFEKVRKMKKKRNVGDGFKHIVTDNWSTDMVVTFNLRSLKNYFDLRDSGAAWFQIQALAKAMKMILPVKYLKLIDKEYK